MINRVVLVGRLTKDPELRYTPNGVAACSFTLAVNRTFSNSQGEREADFINVVTWRKQAENSANYLKKGSLAGIEGRIQTRSYENNEGKRIYVTEVIADSVQFLEPKRDNQESSYQRETPPASSNRQSNSNAGSYSRGQQYDDGYSGQGGVVTDDDLPF